MLALPLAPTAHLLLKGTPVSGARVLVTCSTTVDRAPILSHLGWGWAFRAEGNTALLSWFLTQ